jgi:hypothetical protein
MNCALYWSNRADFWFVEKTGSRTDFRTAGTFFSNIMSLFPWANSWPKTFEADKLFIRNWFQLNQQDFETNGHQIPTRRLDKPLQDCFATIQFRFTDFSKTEFLLVLSQSIGFHQSEARIRAHRPRKPVMACPLTYQGILQFHSLETEGVFWGGGRTHYFSRKSSSLDLLLVEKRIPGKFGCTGAYGVRMHKEQTNIHLYILEDKLITSSKWFRKLT